MISNRIRAFRHKPDRTTAAAASATAIRSGAGIDYYGGVVVGGETIGELALAQSTHEKVRDVMARLDPDDYSEYLRSYMEAGQRMAGPCWRYADLVTTLAAAAELLSPSTYLEIGVRRGRSLAVVAAGARNASLLGIDSWVPEYAGMANPGPQVVKAQLQRVGFHGSLELLSGDSHRLLPRLFEQRPDLTFDLITVDGDHTPAGARRDLRDVLPRLRIGGVVVFDDIRHELHPKLGRIWCNEVRDRRYSTWQFDDLGFGVAVAVRRW